jgi:hypothetical protein
MSVLSISMVAMPLMDFAFMLNALLFIAAAALGEMIALRSFAQQARKLQHLELAMQC